jgi:hypothetical protein
MGGIRYFLDHPTSSFESRWESMTTWKTLLRAARQKIIRSFTQMNRVKNASIEKLSKHREKQLAELLRIIDYE